MEDEKADEIIKKKLDEFLSSERLRKIIEKSLNENPPEFEIKAKGAKRANEETKRIESQRDRLDNLCHEYLQATEEAKKNRKLSTEDRLKKLISPLIEIQKILFPDYFDKDLEYHQFVNDGYINLEEELDYKNLVPNGTKYGIAQDTECKVFGLLNTNGYNISLSEQYENYLFYCKNVKPISEAEFDLWKCDFCGQAAWSVREIKGQRCCIECWDKLPLTQPQVRLNSTLSPPRDKSISEIWPDWLPTLNQESIKSNDLLIQILVCYTIKRALNGDEKAIQKLYRLYENAAVGLAINTAKKLHLRTSEWDEIRQDAKILLRLLISGFRPEYILSELFKGEKNKTIDAIPKWVKKFYIWYLSEYIPKRIRELLNKAELIDLINGKQEWKFDLGLEAMVLLNPYRPIHEGTRAKVTPKRTNRFNSYSYRPLKMGPRSNLTLWLFGTSHKDPKATLYRLLRDKYLPIIKKRQKEIDVDFRDDFDEDHKERLPFEERTKALRAKDAPLNKSPEEIIAEIKKHGICQRDAEIFTKWKFRRTLSGERIPQANLAKQYHLSEQWIRKICRRVEHIVNFQ